jgi:hypothetical protein
MKAPSKPGTDRLRPWGLLQRLYKSILFMYWFIKRRCQYVRLLSVCGGITAEVLAVLILKSPF